MNTKKEYTIRVRVTVEEAQKLKAKAEQQSTTYSKLIREAIKKEIKKT